LIYVCRIDMNWLVLLAMILILAIGMVSYRNNGPAESIIITLVLLMIFYIAYGYYIGSLEGFQNKLNDKQKNALKEANDADLETNEKLVSSLSSGSASGSESGSASGSESGSASASGSESASKSAGVVAPASGSLDKATKPTTLPDLEKLIQVIKPSPAQTVIPNASASEIGTVVTTSPGLQQGTGYTEIASKRCQPPKPKRCPQPAPTPSCACQQPIMPDGKPFDPNMYIRKDSIPCWNCQLPI
jgi:hypothetical protein